MASPSSTVKGCSQLDMLLNEDIQSEVMVSPLFKKWMNIRTDGGNTFFAWKTTTGIPKTAYFYATQTSRNVESPESDEEF